jgi:hypothetical protein
MLINARESGSQDNHGGSTMTTITSGRSAGDKDLVDLVDAIVAAIDLARTWEVEQVRTVLAGLGAERAFTEELRLNGRWSECHGDCWAEVAS